MIAIAISWSGCSHSISSPQSLQCFAVPLFISPQFLQRYMPRSCCTAILTNSSREGFSSSSVFSGMMNSCSYQAVSSSSVTRSSANPEVTAFSRVRFIHSFVVRPSSRARLMHCSFSSSGILRESAALYPFCFAAMV